MINKTKSSNKKISVIFSYYNDEHRLPSFLSSLARQSHPPDEIIGLDRGSTDRSSIILSQWQNRFNLRFKQKSIKPGGETLNFLLEQSNSDYIFPLKLNIRPRDNYLETLIKLLNKKKNIVAAGGEIQLKGNHNGFQTAIEKIHSHQLFPGEIVSLINRSHGLIYRSTFLSANKTWKKKLTHSAQIELMTRLKNEGNKIISTDQTSFRILPPGHWRQFFTTQRSNGQILGELASNNSLPSLSFWRADRLLTLWSISLAWNPFGWGLVLLFQIYLVCSAIHRGLKFNSSWRIIYLFPLLLLGWWMGWLNCRFNLRR